MPRDIAIMSYLNGVYAFRQGQAGGSMAEGNVVYENQSARGRRIDVHGAHATLRYLLVWLFGCLLGGCLRVGVEIRGYWLGDVLLYSLGDLFSRRSKR